MNDLISRQAAIDAFYQYPNVNWATLDVMGKINELPPIQPELDIGNDGTLYISVSKGQLDKINRVLVEEDGSIFCKQFY